MLGKLGDVIRDCTKAIELNANDTNAYYLWGVDYQMLLKYPEAIKDFNAVLKLNPNAQDARQARDECQKALDAGGKVVKAADELLKSTNFFNFLRSTNFFNQ